MTKFKKISALALIVFTVVILLSVGLTACNWKQVTIMLDCDGGFLGEDASVSLDVKTGEKTDLSAYVPEKDGYVFGGWSDGKTIYKADYVPTGDVTLKAVWLESSAGSTFNALKALFAALDGGDEAFAFAFEGEGKTADGTVSGLSLKARVSAEDDYTLGFEFSENGEKFQTPALTFLFKAAIIVLTFREESRYGTTEYLLSRRNPSNRQNFRSHKI